MTDNRPASRITPGRRARQAAARGGTAVPAAWNTVIARTADFEPENDGDLLDWMGAEVAAVAAYAEALVDLYEGLTEGTGLDPVAMAALHDVADAQAHASETMAERPAEVRRPLRPAPRVRRRGRPHAARRPLGHRRRRRLTSPTRPAPDSARGRA